MTCHHKTIHDHSTLTETHERIWRCSCCGQDAPWTDGWIYVGTVKCRRCEYGRVESVACPHCAPALEAACDAAASARRTRTVLPWQRQARLAGWTPPKSACPPTPRVHHERPGWNCPSCHRRGPRVDCARCCLKATEHTRATGGAHAIDGHVAGPLAECPACSPRRPPPKPRSPLADPEETP